MSECARAAVSLRWPTRFGKVPHRRLRVLCAVSTVFTGLGPVTALPNASAAVAPGDAEGGGAPADS